MIFDVGLLALPNVIIARLKGEKADGESGEATQRFFGCRKLSAMEFQWLS